MTPSDQKYEKLGQKIGQLVDEKNESYGKSFDNSDKILKTLFPDGIMPDQYSDMLAITRIVDKLFRIANNKGAFEESPYKDIAGYGLLGAAKDEEVK
jgi:flagellar hook-associated protein FlgK